MDKESQQPRSIVKNNENTANLFPQNKFSDPSFLLGFRENITLRNITDTLLTRFAKSDLLIYVRKKNKN